MRSADLSRVCSQNIPELLPKWRMVSMSEKLIDDRLCLGEITMSREGILIGLDC